MRCGRRVAVCDDDSETCFFSAGASVIHERYFFFLIKGAGAGQGEVGEEGLS